MRLFRFNCCAATVAACQRPGSQKKRSTRQNKISQRCLRRRPGHFSGGSHNIAAPKFSPGKVENENIQLKDLIQQLGILKNSQKEDGGQGTRVTIREKVAGFENHQKKVIHDQLK